MIQIYMPLLNVKSKTMMRRPSLPLTHARVSLPLYQTAAAAKVSYAYFYFFYLFILLFFYVVLLLLLLLMLLLIFSHSSCPYICCRVCRAPTPFLLSLGFFQGVVQLKGVRGGGCDQRAVAPVPTSFDQRCSAAPGLDDPLIIGGLKIGPDVSPNEGMLMSFSFGQDSAIRELRS